MLCLASSFLLFSSCSSPSRVFFLISFLSLVSLVAFVFVGLAIAVKLCPVPLSRKGPDRETYTIKAPGFDKDKVCIF